MALPKEKMDQYSTMSTLFAQRLTHFVETQDTKGLKKIVNDIKLIDKNDKKLNTIKDSLGANFGGKLLQIAAKKGFVDVLEVLIKEFKFNPDLRPSEEYGTALMLACDYGQVKSVFFLLSQGANPNLICDNTKNLTPLQFATQERLLKDSSFTEDKIQKFKSDCAAIVQALLSKNANPDVQNHCEGTSPLMFAVMKNNPDSIRHLLKAGAKLDLQDKDGFTASMFAVQPESFDKCHGLIIEAQNKGYSIDSVNKKGTDLLLFLINNRFLKGIQFILKAGATITYKHIIETIKRNDLEILKLLLNGPKMSVNTHFPPENTTALQHAARFGNATVVQFLIKSGAEIDSETITGCNALHIASGKQLLSPENRKESHTFKEEHLNCVDLLLKAGANVNHTTKFTACSPVISAALQGNLDILKRLLQEKPNLQHKAKDPAGYEADALTFCVLTGQYECFQELLGATLESQQEIENLNDIVDNAIYRGNLKILKYLIETLSHTEKNIQNLIQESFITAAKCNQLEIMKWLLSKGAISNQPDPRGRNGTTALMIAAFNGHIEVVKVLLQNGALPDIKDIKQRTALSLTRSPGVFKLLKNFGASGGASDELNCQVRLIFNLKNQKDLVLIKEYLEFLDPNKPVIFSDEFKIFNSITKMCPIFIFSNDSKYKEVRVLVLEYKLYSNYPNLPRKNIKEWVTLLSRSCQDFHFGAESELIIKLEHEDIQYTLSLTMEAQSSLLELSEYPANLVDSLLKHSEEFQAISNEKRSRTFFDQIFNLLAKSYNIISKPLEILSQFEQNQNLAPTLNIEDILTLKTKLLAACATKRKSLDELHSHLRTQKYLESNDAKLFQEVINQLQTLFQECQTEIEVPWTKLKDLIAATQQYFSEKLALTAPGFKKMHKVQGSNLKTTQVESPVQTSYPINKPSPQPNLNKEIKLKLEDLETERTKHQKQPSKVENVRKVYLPPKLDPKLFSEDFGQGNSDSELQFYLKVPELPNLDLMLGNLSGHLKAIDGRHQLSHTLTNIYDEKFSAETKFSAKSFSNSNITSNSNSNTRSNQNSDPHLASKPGMPLFIQNNAALGALAQALEARKGLEENWPNRIRNVLFHFEDSIDSFVKNKNEIASIISNIEKSLNCISENDLLKSKGKLSISQIDSHGFLQSLFDSTIPEYNEKRAQEFIQKSENELEQYRKYICDSKSIIEKTSINSEALKQAIGFTLARIGTYLSKMSAQGVNVNQAYPHLCKYIPLGCEYRHFEPKWKLAVNSFIEECLNSTVAKNLTTDNSNTTQTSANSNTKSKTFLPGFEAALPKSTLGEKNKSSPPSSNPSKPRTEESKKKHKKKKKKRK